MTPQNFKDYVVLPLTLPSDPRLATEHAILHYMYLRPHDPKIPTLDSPRSLFIANVPVDASSTQFRALFVDQLGGIRVERVDFESVPTALKKSQGSIQLNGAPAGKGKNKKRKRGMEEGNLSAALPETWDRQLHSSGSTAVVVFVDRPSMELALTTSRKATRSGKSIYWGGKTIEAKLPALGSKRYKTHHSLCYPPTDDLQALVDTYMTAYSSQEAAVSRTRAHQRSVPDADGFITVTRGGRMGPARVEEAKEQMEKMKEKEEKKRREMEMSGFYRFQVRESKKREAKELIGKFEGEKRRAQQLSGRRKKLRPQ